MIRRPWKSLDYHVDKVEGEDETMEEEEEEENNIKILPTGVAAALLGLKVYVQRYMFKGKRSNRALNHRLQSIMVKEKLQVENNIKILTVGVATASALIGLKVDVQRDMFKGKRCNRALNHRLQSIMVNEKLHVEHNVKILPTRLVHVQGDLFKCKRCNRELNHRLQSIMVKEKLHVEHNVKILPTGEDLSLHNVHVCNRNGDELQAINNNTQAEGHQGEEAAGGEQHQDPANWDCS